MEIKNYVGYNIKRLSTVYILWTENNKANNILKRFQNSIWKYSIKNVL